MKKKLLFIESNTTGTGMLLIDKAKSWGLEPFFLTHSPHIYLGLAETGCEIIICDTNSIDELKKVMDSSFTTEEIAGIMTTSEYYLATVSELAVGYGLPGNPPDVIATCRNKHKTRLALAEAHIKQPRFSVVQTISETECAISGIGFPCVVKPLDDSGSNEVRLCETLEEVKVQFHKIIQKNFNPRGQAAMKAVLIEEYLDDPEYSVEMFTWQGISTCVGITEKRLTGYPYFIEYRHIFPAKLNSDAEKDIINTVSAALKAVGFVSGVTHTEIKLTSSGCAIIEINARPAGGMIPELIQHVAGIDLLEVQTKAALGDTPSIQVSYSGYAGIQFIVSDDSGILNEVQGIHEVERLEGVKLVKMTSGIGKKVYQPKNSSHRLGFVIAVADTYQDMERLLDGVHSMIKLKIEKLRCKDPSIMG